MDFLRCCGSNSGRRLPGSIPKKAAKTAVYTLHPAIVSLTKTRQGRGTGVLVTSKLVLTTHGNLPDPLSASACEIVVCYNAHFAQSLSEPQPKVILTKRLVPSRFFHTDDGLDVTVVACEDVGPDVTPLSLNAFHLLASDSPVDLGRKCYLLGHTVQPSSLSYVGFGQSKISGEDPPFVCFPSDASKGYSRWTHGSAGFDVNGRFSFLVCNPPSLEGALSRNSKVQQCGLLVTAIVSCIERYGGLDAVHSGLVEIPKLDFPNPVSKLVSGLDAPESRSRPSIRTSSTSSEFEIDAAKSTRSQDEESTLEKNEKNSNGFVLDVKSAYFPSSNPIRMKFKSRGESPGDDTATNANFCETGNSSEVGDVNEKAVGKDSNSGVKLEEKGCEDITKMRDTGKSVDFLDIGSRSKEGGGAEVDPSTNDDHVRKVDDLELAVMRYALAAEPEGTMHSEHHRASGTSSNEVTSSGKINPFHFENPEVGISMIESDRGAEPSNSECSSTASNLNYGSSLTQSTPESTHSPSIRQTQFENSSISKVQIHASVVTEAASEKLVPPTETAATFVPEEMPSSSLIPTTPRKDSGNGELAADPISEPISNRHSDKPVQDAPNDTKPENQAPENPAQDLDGTTAASKTTAEKLPPELVSQRIQGYGNVSRKNIKLPHSESWPSESLRQIVTAPISLVVDLGQDIKHVVNTGAKAVGLVKKPQTDEHGVPLDQIRARETRLKNEEDSKRRHSAYAEAAVMFQTKRIESANESDAMSDAMSDAWDDNEIGNERGEEKDSVKQVEEVKKSNGISSALETAVGNAKRTKSMGDSGNIKPFTDPGKPCGILNEAPGKDTQIKVIENQFEPIENPFVVTSDSSPSDTGDFSSDEKNSEFETSLSNFDSEIVAGEPNPKRGDVMRREQVLSESKNEVLATKEHGASDSSLMQHDGRKEDIFMRRSLVDGLSTKDVLEGQQQSPNLRVDKGNERKGKVSFKDCPKEEKVCLPSTSINSACESSPNVKNARAKLNSTVEKTGSRPTSNLINQKNIAVQDDSRVKNALDGLIGVTGRLGNMAQRHEHVASHMVSPQTKLSPRGAPARVWPKSPKSPAGSWAGLPDGTYKFIRATGGMTLQQQAEWLWQEANRMNSVDSAFHPSYMGRPSDCD